MEIRQRFAIEGKVVALNHFCFLWSKIKSIDEINPSLSGRRVSDEVSAIASPGRTIPSRTTIQRYFKKSGFKQEIVKMKPLSRASNIKKRLVFAKSEIVKMVSDQNYSRNILWSYEIVILAYPNNKKVLIWIGQLDDKHENSINQQVQQGEFKVMFWGCFSRNTYGPLVEVRWPKIPGFDQDSY